MAHSAPHLIVAQKTGNTLTDPSGNPLKIKPHPALTRLAGIVKPNPAYCVWLQDPAQDERLISTIQSTTFRVSTRGETRTLLNAPSEWAIVWRRRHGTPLTVILLAYDDLTPAEERALVEAEILRLVGLPLLNRAKAQLGMAYDFFGQSKQAYSTRLMGASKTNIHFHLGNLPTTKSKPKASTPGKPKAAAPISGTHNEGVHLDQDLRPQPAGSPNSPPSSANSLPVIHQPTVSPSTDTGSQGPPLEQKSSSESIPISAAVESVFDPSPAQAESAPSAHDEDAHAGQSEQLLPPSDPVDDGRRTLLQTNAGTAQVSPGQAENEPVGKVDGDNRLQSALTELKLSEIMNVNTQAPVSTSRTSEGRGSDVTHPAQLILL